MAKIPDANALGQRPTPQVSGGVSIPNGAEVGSLMARAGQITAAAGSQLEQASDEVYRRSKLEQEKRDATRAEDAFNQLRERQLDLTVGEENGFQRVKGSAANHDLVVNWSERFKQSSSEIELSLDNDEQKRRYRARAGASGIQFQHELLTHLAKESDAYAKETFEGVVRTEIRSAASRWDDPTAVEFSVARVSEEVAKRGEALNWPNEYREAIRLQEGGKIHSAVIMQAIASGQWEYAQKWYEANKADVDPQTAKVLEKAVEDGTQKQLASGYTSDFLANRDNRLALDELEKRVSADPQLDETRKNAILGRVMARGETLDRRDEAERTRQAKILERGINQVNANTLAGFPPSVEQITPLLNAATGTEHEGEARQMVALANATSRFVAATPQQQEVYITGLEATVRKDPTKLDIKWVNAFKEIHQRQQAALGSDPTTFALRQGLVQADQPAAQPLDLSKPETLGDQLTGRFALARGMADRYQAPFKPFTKEEVDTAVGMMRTASVDQKRTFFGGLAQAARGDMDGYRAVMAQIATDDPVTAHGGVMAGRGIQTKDGEFTVGRGTYVSELIFRGQALMNPNKKEDGKPTHGKLWPMPEGKDEKTMRDVFESEEKGAFAGMGPARENYLQTAKAIYVALSEDARDATTTLDSGRWKTSIKLATGGFTDVGGKRVPLPYGQTEASFKDGVAARIEASAGNLPDTVTPKKLLDLPLQVAGDGRYVFRSGDSVVLGKDNRPIVIDFNRSAPFKTSGAAPGEFDDARRGELGVLNRPDGGVSTELSITVTDPRLNGGKATNIPLLVRGQVDIDALLRGDKPNRTQEERAIERAAARVRRGANLPGYGSIDEAVAAAKSRPVSEKMKTAK